MEERVGLCSRFFGNKRFLLGVIIRPDTLNSCSDAELLAEGRGNQWRLLIVFH